MNQRQKIKKLKREKQFYALAFRMACMKIERLSDMLAVRQNFTPIEIDKKFGIMDSDGNAVRTLNQRQKIKKLKREKQFYALAFRMAYMKIERLSGMLAAEENFIPLDLDEKFVITDAYGKIIWRKKTE